ncbi:hypothetical protein ACIO3O_41115 [Streptomyces sp. NPDC087440]|uniref:hypothetical protein n=1 Tax=Streptomyces sp. NPDC087440 TaxID=3365790 RepID=UPI00380278E9
MDARPLPPRLTHALDQLALVFRGMTAPDHADQCTCHWGSEEELALLKVPDVELDPDLLRRTWQTVGWLDAHDGVLRRILPQLCRALAEGTVETFLDSYDEVGRCFAVSTWQQWPAAQRDAIREFLHAWWEQALTAPETDSETDSEAAHGPPAHAVLVGCVEATGTLTPWLAAWEDRDDDISARHLARAVEHWAYDLLCDVLPWPTWAEDEEAEALRAELTGWLLRCAPPRLRRVHAPDTLLHQVRLMGLTGLARWEDPHWPYTPSPDPSQGPLPARPGPYGTMTPSPTDPAARPAGEP